MPNHLATENSLYLLQHADNPVDWYPWGSLALDRACLEDKPIFLSIGYAACHWCHVMAHESFEDSLTAAFMNEHYINIKVDREERPDLDSIYMQAVISITGQGGWPMSVFLTPNGAPFFGGTYYPPVRRYNMPAFYDVLVTIARLWQEDRTQLLENSDKIKLHLEQALIQNSSSHPLNMELLNKAVINLGCAYDWTHGGWGKEPKFPQPMTIDFLLRKATRGDTLARDIASHALRAIAKGGMYDVIGGGFARYSTDDSWCIPHFEKMLYDNAQLALAYLHCWLVTQDDSFRHVCEHTLEFLSREMAHPLGGFYSSLDADSDGKEGKYYVWTKNEIQMILNNPQDIEFLTAAYEITESGNFEGANVLQRVRTDDELAVLFDLPVNEIFKHLENIHKKLLTARQSRIRPATDDKILVSWNGFALAAFAEAARYLGRSDYLTVAQSNARFLLENLFRNGRLYRSWRNGQVKHNAFLEDYASLAIGLLSLYQSDANEIWYSTSIQLTNKIISHFADVNGGFFDTSKDHESLIVRPKDLQDNATPSGNALTAILLLQLATYEGRSDWRSIADKMLTDIQNPMMQYPTAFGQWLQAADFALGPIKEVAVIGDPHDPHTQILSNTIWKSYQPRLVAGISKFPPETKSPTLVKNRKLHNGLPTAYVCQDFICLHPTNSPDTLATQLDDQNAL